MANKRFSEFRKGGDRIKVYAKGFNSNRSVQLTGNVTGSAQSDMDEGTTLSIATTIADNAITNSKLSDGAVSTSKLQDDAVTSAKIDTGAVTVNKLGAGAVETDKIANGAVTLQKISSSAIDTEPTDSSDNLITSGGVKTALDDLDAEVTSNDGINVQAKVTEVDGKITALNITTDETENRNNKVDSWQVTPDNTHYPSEKLAKDSLDAKVDIANIDLDGKTTTILDEVKALATKSIHYARFYTRGDGGAADISDKPVPNYGFLCEVLCNRFAGTTNYRYLVTCWVHTEKNPYWVYIDNTTASITWSRLNAYVAGAPTNNNLVSMDANGLIKDSGKSPLLGNQTWDGTSDAKLPTANAVQGAIDAKVKGNADVSSMGTDDTHAYSGKAISTAISNAISGTTGGFLGEKTIAEMNAYTNPKMGDNALISNTGTITVGNVPCVISQAPAEVRWTTDGSWIETSDGYVRDTKVATTQELGLVRTNPTDGGVILNNNNQMLVQGWGDKASASDVTSLEGRVTTAEGDITMLQASVAEKLNKSDAVWTIDDSDDAIIVDDDFMTWMFQA